MEKRYNQEKLDKVLKTETVYEYAHCLVKSRYKSDMHKGIQLLEELFATNPAGRRDYMYYLAIGYAKLADYRKSIHYIRDFLNVEPNNKQMLDLENVVQQKLDDEGLKGILIIGGVAVLVGSLVTAGLTLFSKKP